MQEDSIKHLKNQDHKFSVGEKVVYSSHGVGEIVDMEVNSYGGSQIRFYVINLINQKMSIRVPANKTGENDLREMTRACEVDSIFDILRKKSNNLFYKSRARKFVDYKQKLNSGSILDLAEVVRDLYKSDCLTTSYSQKIIYESALTRLANELALLLDVKLDQMLQSIEELLVARI